MMMFNYFIFVIFSLIINAAASPLFAGMDVNAASNLFFSHSECDSVTMDQNWSLYGTSSCNGAPCNFPSQACFEDPWAAMFGDPPKFECRAISQACLDAVNGVTTTTTAAPAGAGHPGSCPASPSGFGWCFDTCASDADCWDDEKCCSDGCGGTECIRADLTGAPATTTTKATTTTTKATTTTTKATTTTTTTTTPKPTTTTATTTTTTPTTTTTTPTTTTTKASTTPATTTTTKASTTPSTTTTTKASTTASTTTVAPVTAPPSGAVLPILPTNPICSQPKATGVGIQLTERYHFNGYTCQTFYYAGMLGNQNNFGSLAECQATCPVTPNCFEPPNLGDGINLQTRYYYTGSGCSVMWFRGNGGNSNNFASVEECMNKCNGATNTPPTVAPSTAPITKTTTTPATTTTTTKAPVTASAVCNLPSDKGTGRMFRFSYYWTGTTCSQFLYYGTGGNGNNFMSVDECMTACAGAGAVAPTTTTTTQSTTTTTINTNDCTSARDQGSGRSWQLRFYFDQSSNACQRFWFAGTGGNGNNYGSFPECVQSCPSA